MTMRRTSEELAAQTRGRPSQPTNRMSVRAGHRVRIAEHLKPLQRMSQSAHRRDEHGAKRDQQHPDLILLHGGSQFSTQCSKLARHLNAKATELGAQVFDLVSNLSYISLQFSDVLLDVLEVGLHCSDPIIQTHVSLLYGVGRSAPRWLKPLVRGGASVGEP